MSLNPQPLTLAEFLAWEQRQPTKFEYRDGAVFAMAGATDDHGQIVMNLSAIIRPALRGTTCRAYPLDMKVVTTYPGSRYPDLVVTCDKRDARERLVKRHPKLIIEVLSTGTASVDTGDKLDEYQTIAELEEYVLIDSRKPSVRIYRRDGETLKTDPAAITGSIELRSLGLRIALSEIYEDVDFERARSERSEGPASPA
jgi:Uma2 family endonuclease